MSRVAERVQDKRVLKLIRALLNAGVMDAGLVSPTNEGTPQGGLLSPLLSNLVLDELDQEPERRGHRLCRYADDCNIYVRSERAVTASDGGHQPIHHQKASSPGQLTKEHGDDGSDGSSGLSPDEWHVEQTVYCTTVSTAIPGTGSKLDQSEHGGEAWTTW